MAAPPAGAKSEKKKIKAELSGASEVPSVSTLAEGEFSAVIAKDGSSIEYTLSYEALSTAAMFAHIHFGQTDVNGGVSTFLCGGGGKPACPATDGSVSGVIVAADVVDPAGQGIAAGEMAELIDAIHEGLTYVNVHTAKHPSGEIRGQVR